MASGTRYSQRLQNFAREKQYGMGKIAYDGRFLPADEDKVAVSMEGPASPEKFELVRSFLQLFIEIRNEKQANAAEAEYEPKRVMAQKLREYAATLEGD